jgi:hypothetical protein
VNQVSVAGRLRQFWTECGWLTLGCIFVLMAVRSEAEKSETTEMKAHRQHIANMTQTERDRLEHNQEQFRQLSASDKEVVRSMHESVTNDENLDQTLAGYHHWLVTLPPNERNRVLTAAPEQRLREIETILNAAPVEDWNVGNNGPDRPTGRFQIPFWMRGSRGPVFPPAEFEALVDAIAEWLNTDFHPPGDSQLAVLRYQVNVIDAMVARVAFAARNGRIDRERPVIPEQLIQRIDRALHPRTSSKVIPQLRGQPTVFLQTILRTLGNRMLQELESNGPTLSQLETILSQQPNYKRRELEMLDGAARDVFLTRIWLEQEHSDIMQAMQRISAVLSKNKTQRLQIRRPSQRG